MYGMKMQEDDGCFSVVGNVEDVLGCDKGQAQPVLKRHWCKWDGRPEGRANRMPHISTYLRHKCDPAFPPCVSVFPDEPRAFQSKSGSVGICCAQDHTQPLWCMHAHTRTC